MYCVYSVCTFQMQFFVQLCSNWQDYNWHSMSCSASAIAELFVLITGCLAVCSRVGTSSMAVPVRRHVYSAAAACSGSCHLSAAGPAWHQPITACPHAHWHGHLSACDACCWLRWEKQIGHLLEQWNKSHTLADDRYSMSHRFCSDWLSIKFLYITSWPVWLNGRAFAHDPKGREFEPRPVHFQVTAMGMLLTRMCLCHQAV